MGGFEATFLSSYLASSAVLNVGSRGKRREKEGGGGLVLAREPRQFLAGGARESRSPGSKDKEKKKDTIVSHTRARAIVHLQIPLRERFDRSGELGERRDGGQYGGVVGSRG